MVTGGGTVGKCDMLNVPFYIVKLTNLCAVSLHCAPSASYPHVTIESVRSRRMLGPLVVLCSNRRAENEIGMYSAVTLIHTRLSQFIHRQLLHIGDD